MVDSSQKRTRRFLIALLIGAVAGAFVALVLRLAGWNLNPFAGPGSSAGAQPGGSAPAALEDSVAWRYARAYQEGDWERVLELTLWAQERLQYVQKTEGSEAVPAERDVLLASFSTRSTIENQLQKAGVEDQYVFAPGARLDFESVDDGREDLERPVARRTWITVTYPAREHSLLDIESLPIRSLRVGINVSQDGYVLKASIIGNLDIDWSSVTYNWPLP